MPLSQHRLPAQRQEADAFYSINTDTEYKSISSKNMKNEKKELWRSQTLVNRKTNDFQIATEYFQLAEFVVENYELRFEIIQNPLLHIMSHCIELRYKETLMYAAKNYYKDKSLQRSIAHSHKLSKLCKRFEEVCNQLIKDALVSKDDADLFVNHIIPDNQKLVSILQTDTTVYRYANKIDNNGDITGKGTPFATDEDSPNIKTVFPLFEACNNSIPHVLQILECKFPEIE